MRLHGLAIAIASLLSTQTYADILISEYIEGSSYNKAIELANTSNTPVTLTGYTLQKSTNGGGSWTQSMSLDDVTIPANSAFVISRTDANTAIQAVTDKFETSKQVINFNGDDPVGLFLNGTLIDMVGVMGDINFGKDKTLVRRTLVPTASYDSGQWEVFTKNNSENLGFLDGAGDQPPVEEPELTKVTIMEIQGNSWSSPLIDSGFESDDKFQVEGIITAIQPKQLGNDISVGFFIQDENGDNDPLTSDALFVEADITGLNTGDKVLVTGKVYEDFGWTSLIQTQVEVLGSGFEIAATPIRTLASDESFREALERHEGMLVQLDLTANLRVTRTYGFDYGPYRNNMVVAHERVNLHPNQLNAPSSDEAKAQTSENRDRRIFVESFEKAANGVVPWYPEFGLTDIDQDGSTEDYIRIGDLVNGLEGVLGYSYSEFRLYVTNEADQTTFVRQSNERTQAPELKEGDLKVATFNVLNYFNSPFGGAANPLGQNRGATKFEDFELQAAKIVAALKAMDADIIGLMEIENNGFDSNSAIVDLVTRLNTELTDKKQYSIAWDGQITQVGGDAITNQVIYRPSKVSIETLRVIKMPEQHAPAVDSEDGNNYQRDAITPTFNIKGTDELLTIAVNHFKSKGSTCWEDVALQGGQDPNLQGSCEHLRVSAAYHLGESLEALPGHKLIIGDLNAYGKEDAISVLTNRKHLPESYEIKAARDTWVGETPLHGENGAIIEGSYDYINVVQELHPETYGYSFNDEVGTLDYILASASLSEHVVDAAEWNINAVESKLFVYSPKYTGDLPKYADAFSSSDHDPALVVLSFEAAQPELLGDLDSDQDVDRMDLNLFYQGIRAQTFTDMAYDFNQDGQINRYDLRGLMSLCTRARCATH